MTGSEPMTFKKIGTIKVRFKPATPMKARTMGTSASQDASFLSEVISNTLLEEAIDWIRSNMEPDEVFEEDELREWAQNNGFVEEE